MCVVGGSCRPGTGASVGRFALLLASLSWIGCVSGSGSPPVSSPGDPVARGEYLVAIAGCDDCHTPLRNGPNGPEPDLERRLSGHPANLSVGAPPPASGGWVWSGSETNTASAGPWGVSYAPNLTPAAGSGLGLYTEDAFVQALRTGKHFGAGREILPPMPWRAYARMTDEDLRAIHAYLATLRPIENVAPGPTPPATDVATAR